MANNVAVLIPTYKAPEKVTKCLDAVEKSVGIQTDIYQFDNTENNIGFTKAVNKLLKMVYLNGMHEYAVILNQDCYLKPEAIKNMVAFMDKHPLCFIGSIKQLSDQDEDMIIHGGTLEVYPYGRHVGGYVSKGNCNISKRMPWANGACMIVRLDMIIDVGLMDENFFLIGSDSDWSFTARSRGFEVWYIADAVCVHEQGVTSGDASKELSRHMISDVNYFRTKWIGSELFKELSMEVFD
jgi:GT2 family glycosyltransferase